MAFGFARMSREAYLLQRQEIEASLRRQSPIATFSPDAEDPLSAVVYPDNDEAIESALHLHFVGCTCGMRGS